MSAATGVILPRNPPRPDERNRLWKGAGLPRRAQETLRKGPFLIHPLSFAAESGALRHLDHLFRCVFIGAFGPDGFIFFQPENQLCAADDDCLPVFGAEMHLDASLLRVI